MATTTARKPVKVAWHVENFPTWAPLHARRPPIERTSSLRLTNILNYNRLPFFSVRHTIGKKEKFIHTVYSLSLSLVAHSSVERDYTRIGDGSLNGTLLKAISVSRFCEQRIKCYSCFYLVKVNLQVFVLLLRLDVCYLSRARCSWVTNKCLIFPIFKNFPQEDFFASICENSFAI